MSTHRDKDSKPSGSQDENVDDEDCGHVEVFQRRHLGIPDVWQRHAEDGGHRAVYLIAAVWKRPFNREYGFKPARESERQQQGWITNNERWLF